MPSRGGALSPGTPEDRQVPGLISAFPESWPRSFSLHIKGVPAAQLCSLTSSSLCLLKKERESGTAVAWAQCCVPGSHWPSVSLLTASLSSSQRSSPLTQTAGKVMETIFSYKTFLLCSVYVSGSGGTFEHRPFTSTLSLEAWVLGTRVGCSYSQTPGRSPGSRLQPGLCVLSSWVYTGWLASNPDATAAESSFCSLALHSILGAPCPMAGASLPVPLKEGGRGPQETVVLEQGPPNAAPLLGSSPFCTELPYPEVTACGGGRAGIKRAPW